MRRRIQFVPCLHFGHQLLQSLCQPLKPDLLILKWKLEPDHLILEQNIRRTRQHIKVSETRIKGRWIPNLRLVDYPPTWREQSHPNHVQAQHQNSKHKIANPSLHRYDLDLILTKQYIDFNMLSQVPFNPNFCHQPRRQGQMKINICFHAIPFKMYALYPMPTRNPGTDFNSLSINIVSFILSLRASGQP